METKFKRKLDLAALLKKKSIFLFGPRSVGKTTLIKADLPEALFIDLLDGGIFDTLIRNPTNIEERYLESRNKLIVIDEIQKLPRLLDEVHRLIEKYKIQFLLTGSSARKLRHGAANLLGGRAWQASLMPLCFAEIPQFDLLKYLNRGGLPYVYLADEDYLEELSEYISLYVREEVKAEALTRNIEAFVRFLDTLGLNNGKEINFQGLSSDSGVPARTIENYISILEDTLIGFKLAPLLATKNRKAITRSKFYFFDVGVANVLAHRGAILPKSAAFGDAFEHFIICELRAHLSYKRSKQALQYWRSTSKFEVDCIIGRKLAVEIKATALASDKHLKGLRALKEEGIVDKFVLVSLDKHTRCTTDGIDIIPWRIFLEHLWDDRFAL